MDENPYRAPVEDSPSQPFHWQKLFDVAILCAVGLGYFAGGVSLIWLDVSDSLDKLAIAIRLVGGGAVGVGLFAFWKAYLVSRLD